VAVEASERARRWLRDAARNLEEDVYDNAIYHSQMCVETSAKAVLIALGIDYPRDHDVSDVFRRLKERRDLPGWFAANIDYIASAIESLALKRGPSSYGYEHGIDPESFREEAGKQVNIAERCHTLCDRFIRELYAR